MSIKVGDHVEMIDDTDENVPKFTKGIIRRIFQEDNYTTLNVEFRIPGVRIINRKLPLSDIRIL